MVQPLQKLLQRLFQIYKQSYPMILQSHSWEYIQTKLSFEKMHVPWCSRQHSSPQPRHGCKLSIKRWMDKEGVLHIVCILLSHKKNEIIPFAATWMDLEIIVVSEVRQRKTNVIWYHLYVESKIQYKWTYLQNRNRLYAWVFTNIENQFMVTEVERTWGGIN